MSGFKACYFILKPIVFFDGDLCLGVLVGEEPVEEVGDVRPEGGSLEGEGGLIKINGRRKKICKNKNTAPGDECHDDGVKLFGKAPL